MLTQTVTITQNSNPNIIIGRRSTYETQQVIFDVSWLIQTYGEGTAELLIKRPKDASAYPVVATLDGNTLTWTVSETDTQDKGHGECEIYWYVNGGLAKSCICGITILRDIGDTTETAPDPYETWVDELARLGAETLANAQAAEQSANNAAQSASEADNSAAAALESEENALNSENAAKASEQAAAASAQGAEQSASAARQYATEAAQSASAAESSEANAQESADNASASADRAEQAAASIEGDTERAEAAAREAQGAASYASGFADTASTKATEAAASASTAGQAANTATQKAADASASATAAAGSASSASASATAADNAQTAAETAQGKAEDAQEAAETAAQSIEDSAAQITQNAEDIVDLKSAFEAHEQYAEETYAKQDGSYEDLTAGNAYELLSDRGDTNAQPYLFRQTGGDSSAYNREQLKKIVGGTVAWNQLLPANPPGRNNPYTKNGLTFVTNADGGISVTGTFSGGDVNFYVGGRITAIKGHVYLCFGRTSHLRTSFYGAVTLIAIQTASGVIGTAANDGDASVYFRADSTLSQGDTLNETVYAQLFDLTQMFGTAIADYIYSLEQATAGAGVAFFRSMFPADYYDYNPGELKSVEGVSAHIMRDADNNIVGNYPLDSSLTLRGIPQLDSNNRLYYDGDTYEPDGTVNRRYGVVDLGTLNWAKNASLNLFYTNVADAKFAGTTKGAPAKCSALANAYDMVWSGWANQPEHSISVGNNYSSGSINTTAKATEFTDAAAFKAAMSGVMLVYELATPTTETAEPYRELQICDRDGTEEFVSTSIVPVGHETFYPVNVFDYIDRLTEPDADMIADSAIAANKYFSVGNRLFLSTSSIAAGAQIIHGTNCTETSLAAALNALNT